MSTKIHTFNDCTITISGKFRIWYGAPEESAQAAKDWIDAASDGDAIVEAVRHDHWLLDGEETILNLTPHDVRVVEEHGEVVHPSLGEPSRCVESATGDTIRWHVSGLPPRTQGVRLIVSRPVAAAARRADLRVVTGEGADERGRYCTGLARFLPLLGED